MKDIIKNEFYEHIKVANSLLSLTDELASAAQLCIDSIKSGGKILLLGNGGSAADAQHIAAELIGRYKTDRKSIPAIALSTDTSVITAIANDYGYDNVFKRQIEGIANKGDVVIGISTSGNSVNVINALNLALELNCKTIGLTGEVKGAMNDICNINLAVQSRDTPRIQEMHIIIGHTICHLIEQEL
jgi:D-sedoheptulose 7-phosphate isomerase